MPTRVRLVSLALVLALPWLGCGSAHGSPKTADSQVKFGVDMAQIGLWSEAFFRFEQAHRMEGGNSPQLLNNLAVASEALGKFDQALDYYKQGLTQAPGDRELKANYDRFVSFYESFRARGDEKGTNPNASNPNATQPAATATEPAADSGTPAPSEPTPLQPPQLPIGGAEPPGAGPDTGPPDIPPLVPEPAPTPPNQTSDASFVTTAPTAPSFPLLTGVAAHV